MWGWISNVVDWAHENILSVMHRSVSHVVIAVVGWTAWNQNNPRTMDETLCICLAAWQVTLWSTVLLCRYLEDCRVRQKPLPWWVTGKLVPLHTRSEPKNLWHVAIRNMMGMGVGTVVLFKSLEQWEWWDWNTPRHNAILACTGYILSYEVLFYTAHYILHRIPWLKSYHALHHTCWASHPLTGYYMTWIDFALEHGTIAVLLVLFQTPSPAWLMLIMLGTANVLVTHSAWDIRWCTDPRRHYYHHNGGADGSKSNLGMCIDVLVGTNRNTSIPTRTGNERAIYI